MAGGGVTITDNEFAGNDRAIALDQADGLIDGNRIRDGEIGIFTFEGESRAGAPTIADNDIEVSGWGIDLAPGTGGVVSGNTVCGGEVSIDVEADTDASVTDTRSASRPSARTPRKPNRHGGPAEVYIRTWLDRRADQPG